MEERRASVANLEQHIAQRRERLVYLGEDIRTIDQRVESGIEDIVRMVSAIRDSNDSRYRVSKLKGDVIGRLRGTIEYYDRQRNGLREQLRKENTAVPKETLEGLLDEATGPGPQA